MSMQLTESVIGDLLDSWVAQHNRSDDYSSPDRQEMWFAREEGGLQVTDHTTFYYANGELDAMGNRLIATFRSVKVFERAGGEVKVYVEGDWINIVKPKG